MSFSDSSAMWLKADGSKTGNICWGFNALAAHRLTRLHRVLTRSLLMHSTARLSL